MKAIVLWAFLAGTAAVVGVQAQPQAAVAQAVPPAEVVQALTGATLRGRTTMRFLGMDIYEARLWTPGGFALERYAQAPFALELEYRRSLSGRMIAQRSIAEMRRQHDFAADRSGEWQERMQALFPDVKTGDRITGQYEPGVARFWVNGRPVGEVRDADFARLFFGIWLSAQTSEPQARCALAGCP